MALPVPATSSLSDIFSTQAKLEARQKSSRTVPLIDRLIDQLESHKRTLDESSSTSVSEVLTSDVKTCLDQFQKDINEDQKETYNAQSKHGKAIAKRFKLDLASVTEPNVFSGKEHLINNAIALSFVRQGQFDIAASFAEEAKLDLDAFLVRHFQTMYAITSNLESEELSEAIKWAATNRSLLQARHSTLEFELHKARYTQIFTTSHVFRCIDYAQQNFAPFADRHLKEIQQLMAATAFHSSVSTSPYASLFLESDLMRSVKQSFITEFTALLSMTPTSPLHTTIEAADLALPTLIKLSSLKVAAKQGASVDLPLPKELRFHSVFVCPVTKEVGGEAWMLGCGHVIGGEAMHSLSKGTPKLKCPYCPAISELSSGVKLIL